jgi:hypothetical protein
MRRFTIEERRARLALRHHLAPSSRAEDVVEAARDIVAFHATDPSSVYLSAWARLRKPTVAAIEQALYEDRSLLRMLGMRRTMFVVATDLAPVVQAACTNDIAIVERKRLVQLLTESGVPDAGEWLDDVNESTVRVLAGLGEATGAQIAALEPRLRQKLAPGGRKQYGPPAAITTFVLMRLAADGRIVRGRPNGSWISGQYKWSPMERWLPDSFAQLPADGARAELARLWLKAFGPATAADLKWWTGWNAGRVTQALKEIGAVDVDLDGTKGFVLPDDLEPQRRIGRWVALLPGLDPTVMGWISRDWYLGPHASALFDRTGNAGPTIWCDGRVVGGWGQRKSGEIVYRVLEDIGKEANTLVAADAERLQTWLGSARVTPRFRTPLERELAG